MWGKIIGGMAGFAFGGPFGALMGAAFGHAAETGLNSNTRFTFNVGFGPSMAALPIPREQLFALGVVIMAAKLARCDGPVSRTEIDAFKRAFRIPPEAVRDIGLLFDEARESPEDPVVFARRLGTAFHDQTHRLEDVLNALFAIAASDGPVNAQERALLGQIATAFGLSRDAWTRAGNSLEDDPYATLGLTANASPEEVRATWRRLVVEHHPDSVASRGATASAVAAATDKVAKINAAWDRIKRDRGL